MDSLLSGLLTQFRFEDIVRDAKDYCLVNGKLCILHYRAMTIHLLSGL